jgi:hypothetical protein
MGIPGLRMPSRGPGPRISWLSSLRPHAQSLRPLVEVEPLPASPASLTRIRRWSLAVGCALGCGALAGAALAIHHGSRSVQSVVSGRAGLRKTSTGAFERWSSPAVTITIDPSLAGATPAAKEAIMDAFGAWAASGAYLPQLSFNAAATPGPAEQDGINRLLLGPITLAGHENDLAITVSYADADTGDVIETDTIFNRAYEWTSMTAPAPGKGEGQGCDHHYDLQNVATHEAGHFFGLGEDYSDGSTTMYVSSMPCQTSKRILSSADVAVVSGLYAQPLAGPAAKAGCAARVATGDDGAAAPMLALLGLLATGTFARRSRQRRLPGSG